MVRHALTVRHPGPDDAARDLCGNLAFLIKDRWEVAEGWLTILQYPSLTPDGDGWRLVALVEGKRAWAAQAVADGLEPFARHCGAEAVLLERVDAAGRGAAEAVDATVSPRETGAGTGRADTDRPMDAPPTLLDAATAMLAWIDALPPDVRKGAEAAAGRQAPVDTLRNAVVEGMAGTPDSPPTARNEAGLSAVLQRVRATLDA